MKLVWLYHLGDRKEKYGYTVKAAEKSECCIEWHIDTSNFLVVFQFF